MLEYFLIPQVGCNTLGIKVKGVAFVFVIIVQGSLVDWLAIDIFRSHTPGLIGKQSRIEVAVQQKIHSAYCNDRRYDQSHCQWIISAGKPERQYEEDGYHYPG